MTVVEKTLEDLIGELSPDLRKQVRDFTEFLLEKQRKTQPNQQPITTLSESPVESPEARGWPMGYFENVIGSMPDFPDIDRTSDGIDPSLDKTDEELSLDTAIKQEHI